MEVSSGDNSAVKTVLNLDVKVLKTPAGLWKMTERNGGTFRCVLKWVGGVQ